MAIGHHRTGDLAAAIAGFDSIVTDREARYGPDDDTAAAARQQADD